jgi:transposase
MEATGVDWIPVYERLEVRGFDVRLVNARHLKHVPGRNSEVTDAEWLRDLHSVGLLRGSFRPTAAITTLRADLRHRHTLVESAGIYTQRIEKALVQMDVHLTQVVSDITGVTGLRMLRDIVAGQRDPHRLAAHRDARCRASAADIVAALTGHSSPEHLFVLPQNLELFDMCQRQLTTCADAIDAQWATLMAAVPPRAVHPGPARHPQGARQ